MIISELWLRNQTHELAYAKLFLNTKHFGTYIFIIHLGCNPVKRRRKGWVQPGFHPLLPQNQVAFAKSSFITSLYGLTLPVCYPIPPSLLQATWKSETFPAKESAFHQHYNKDHAQPPLLPPPLPLQSFQPGITCEQAELYNNYH